MNATVNDLLTYLQANVTENDPAIRLTHQPTWIGPDGFSIGLGWMMHTDPTQKRYLYHDGRTRVGFSTRCTIHPGKDAGCVVIVNDNINQDRVTALEQFIMQAVE